MSHINVHKTTTGDSLLEINIPSLQKGGEDHSFTDEDAFDAASAIIDMIDNLGNGEALVITVNVF